MAVPGAVAPPPEPPQAVRTPLVTRLLPVLMAAGSLAMLAMLLSSGSPIAQHPMTLLFPVTMALSALAGLASAGTGVRRRRELDDQRRRYLSELSDSHRELSEATVRQRNRMLEEYPDPWTLWYDEESGPDPRLPDGPDFGRARIGLGAVLAEHAVAEVPDTGTDPVTWAGFRALVAAHHSITRAPVSIRLTPGTAIAVTGDPHHGRALLRAMLCGLAARHRPGDLEIAAVVTESTREHWDWLKWLPHAGRPIRRGVPTAGCPRGLLVLVRDTGIAEPPITPGASICLLDLGGTGGPAALTVTAERVAAVGLGAVPDAVPDLIGRASADTCARALAAQRRPPGDATDWNALLADAGDLRVPLGHTGTGEPLQLDIREAAAGGMGPHGLCVGATGSGKSELLRTVALGMIAAHDTEDLNLALIDFKGGATFLDLDRSGHTAAVITNLAAEAHLVDRMAEALTGEITRRQQILRSAGNFAGIADYRAARERGAALPALPALLLIIDEFSELLAQHPEFAEVFAAIGRLGRSLGMHLLLATQRLEEGRLRGLESHLSYRICLRTLSAGESRAVLGTDDAYLLPPSPGAAYLKVGAADPVAFRCAYVSGALPAAPKAQPDHLQPFTAAAEPPGPDAVTTTLIDATLNRVVAAGGTPAHQIWLPPLTRSPQLERLGIPEQAPALTVAIGLIDRVAAQCRTPWQIDLAGAQGHVAVVGGARSGKSTALLTLITALARRHGPDEICFCCLDFGGGALGTLDGLPQLAALATRREPDLVKRIVDHVAAELHRRDTETGRRRPGRLFLVVDGWSTLRADFDALEPAITALAATGLSHGVHVAIAANRWADLRPSLKDQLGTRIELRLGEPLDSEIDRNRARTVPTGVPGAALSPDGLPATLAVPAPGPDTVELLTGRHPGRRVHPVRLLPELVPVADLPEPAGLSLPIGLGGDDEHSPVALDLARQPHVLVLGDAGTGKTNLLRLLCRQLLAAGRRRFYLCDPRASLDGIVAAALRVEEPGPETVAVIDDYELVGHAAAMTALAELLPRARETGLHVLLARRSTGAARAMYDPVLAAVRDSDPIGLQLGGNPDEPPVFGALRPRRLPPGRAVLLTGDGAAQTVQSAWSPTP